MLSTSVMLLFVVEFSAAVLVVGGEDNVAFLLASRLECFFGCWAPIIYNNLHAIPKWGQPILNHCHRHFRFWFALPTAPDQGEYHLEVTIYGVVQGRKQDESP